MKLHKPTMRNFRMKTTRMMAVAPLIIGPGV